MFKKKVGRVTIGASDGWPVWIEVTHPHDGNRLRLEGSSELRDLQYAVESALEFVLKEEKKGGQ